MTRPTPSPSPFSRSARALVVWVSILALAGAVLLTIVILALGISPAEQACYRGQQRLAAGKNDLAAAEFERAVQLDPSMEEAWHGLLEARPTPAECRRFAERFPELFDGQQPVQDPELLVRDRGWDGTLWQRSLAIYEKAVLAIAADEAGNGVALRLDYVGRKEVAGAWAEVRRLKLELQTDVRTPFSFQQLRPFAVYDLDAIHKTLADSVSHFRDPKRWLDLLARTDAAVKSYTSGRAKLERAAATLPDFAPPHLTLAYLDIALGNTTAAAARCRRLLKAQTTERVLPGEERVRYTLARALELGGDAGGAVVEVRRILASRPHDVQARLRLGALYLKLNRVSEANTIADELLKGSVMDVKPSYIKGVASLRSGDFERAAAELKAALEYNPYSIDIHYALARAREGAGDHVSAYQDYVDVAAQTPEPSWSLAAAAACALAGGNAREATEAADAALGVPGLSRTHAGLRDCLLRIKVAAAALQGGRELASLSADDLGREATDRELANYLIAGVRAGQAYVTAETDIPVDDKHLAYFRAAAEKEPSAQYCLAFLLAARGEVKAARELLEQLTAARPGYSLAALHLARLCIIEGRTERAARALEQTGQADRPGPVARALGLVGELQGRKLPGPVPLPDAPGGEELVGPHLALFALAVHADHRAYAQRVLLLDPLDPFADEVLRLTYSHVRTQGLEGVSAAAKADGRLDLALQRGVAAYQAAQNGLYRLAIGRFWRDLPPHL